ncbi:hypothetical protein GCM10008935_05470 [Alkalibacillus silvisoli]|uniref:Uncharacterized protein n=1 Tax=Alkalibacillus silvisoli TaxID=392823 RepID=A0ABP3JJB5_9BACI
MTILSRMRNYKLFNSSMLIILIMIGALQFFEWTKLLDYILLAVAIVLGVLAIRSKHKEWNQ